MGDLKYEFGRIMDEYGSYALLIRNDRKTSCKCIDRISNAPNDKCQICLGTGYVNRAERVRVRTKVTTGSNTLPKVVNFTSVGNVGVAIRQFYLENTVRPRRQDLIVMCAWSGLKPILDEYTEIYEINDAEPMRFDKGEIEFFEVVAKSDPINMELRFNSLQQNVGKLTYYIAAR